MIKNGTLQLRGLGSETLCIIKPITKNLENGYEFEIVAASKHMALYSEIIPSGKRAKDCSPCDIYHNSGKRIYLTTVFG